MGLPFFTEKDMPLSGYRRPGIFAGTFCVNLTRFRRLYDIRSGSAPLRLKGEWGLLLRGTEPAF